MAEPVTITLKDIFLRRSSEAGYLPPSLARGEVFFQLADRFFVVGDGTTLPSDLPKVPLRSEADLLRAGSPLAQRFQATDTRTAEIQPRTPGTVPPWVLTDALLRTILRVTPQGDIGVPRLRAARLSRRFGGALGGAFGPRWEQFQKITRRGETGVSALRLGRMSRAYGAVLGGVFGPRWERFLEVTRRGETRVHRLLVARLSRAFGGALGGIFGPRWERALEITRRLETYVRALRLPVNRDKTRWLLSGVMSGNGRYLLRFLPSGRIALTLDPASFVASRLAAQGEPADVIARSPAGEATGQIEDVHVRGGPGQLVGFRTNIDGVWAPHVIRRDLFGLGPALLLPRRTAHGDIGFAQSWEGEGDTADNLIPASAYEPRRCMMLARISNGALVQIPTIGTPFGVDNAIDFWPLKPGSNIGIGAAAMMTQQKFRTANGTHIRAIINTNASYPGYRWDQLKPGNEPWAIGIRQRDAATDIARMYGAQIDWLSVGITHGAAQNGELDGNGNVIDYYAVLGEFVSAHDALNLPGSQRLKYFIDQTAPISQQTVAQDAILLQLQFAIDRSDRVFNIGPRYPYPFRDNIHHTQLGTVRIGALRGYVRHVTMDLGLSWPGVRPTAITISGATVLITMSRPYGMGDLMIDTSSIEAAPQLGQHIRVGGVERTIESVTASGNTLALNLSQTIATGTVAEYSNAFYGPGAPVGTHSGIWGNIKRSGPPNPLLINEDIDGWAAVVRQNVTAS